MNIQPINPSFTGGNATYRVSKNFAQNSVRPFFEYEVLSVIRKQQLPANIKGSNFDITFNSSFEFAKMLKFENTLNNAGIKFLLFV